MLAIDTNVILRFLTRDDEKQYEQARTLIRDETVFIATTVLLETAWVLRKGYRYSAANIVGAFHDLAGLPTVRLEHPERMVRAFEWAAAGMDIADAFHLAASRECEAFVTFDKDLGKAAATLNAPLCRAL